MTEKLKTIGVDREKVWKVLKEIALQKECTLSEVIEDLLEKRKKNGKVADGENGNTGEMGRNRKNRPNIVDSE